MAIVRLTCFRAQCDGCGSVLDDYGKYQAMDSPRDAAAWAVEHAGWAWRHDAGANGEHFVYLWCPSCVESGAAANWPN